LDELFVEERLKVKVEKFIKILLVGGGRYEGRMLHRLMGVSLWFAAAVGYLDSFIGLMMVMVPLHVRIGEL
jgi:hypothetical protein